MTIMCHVPSVVVHFVRVKMAAPDLRCRAHFLGVLPAKMFVVIRNGQAGAE